MGNLSQLCNNARVSRSSYSDAYKLFRSMLRELRREKGVTQIALADLLGMPQSYVSKYELGERRIDLVETFEICRALNADFAAFVREFIRTLESRRSGSIANPRDSRRKRP